MRNKALYFLIPAALLLAAHVRADSMRCGSQLITQGDSRSEVRARCGEPADVETRTIVRRSYYDLNGRILSFGGDSFEEIPVEIWTYNFGPYKLMRRIQFVGGRVEEIETMGYGYRDEGY